MKSAMVQVMFGVGYHPREQCKNGMVNIYYDNKMGVFQSL